MYKIRKIKFINHPILKNLQLDFCDSSGKAIDTIILAGENGTGKSTILNELYNIAAHNVKYPCIVEFEKNGKIFTINYIIKKNSISGSDYIEVNDNEGLKTSSNSNTLKEKYHFNGIYSDVDINFNARELNSVTSLNLDDAHGSRRSTNDLPTQIKQLIIDIQALDDADVAKYFRDNPKQNYENSHIEERMKRFITAFNMMFDNLTYSKIINEKNHKSIIFEKFGKEFPIDNLSSGEKQIVYRGCFLLKDKNAINGAFVFIDEPEISLHPNWQKKIMNFYKNIFTDENGKQTSQIFAVTHSPFIIHNDYRFNDKVIILAYDAIGNIIVKNNPEYYNCNYIDAVKEAFNINDFSEKESVVYVAGRTDEKYLNKALDVFGYTVPFYFKWIGYIDDNGQEVNTGDKALGRVNEFLISRNQTNINICLYDFDAQKVDSCKNNIYVKSIPKYNNSKGMKKGIENALILDDVNVSKYYTTKVKEGDYGNNSTIVEFSKMEFCDYICSLDQKKLEKIFLNLNEVIKELIKIF